VVVGVLLVLGEDTQNTLEDAVVAGLDRDLDGGVMNVDQASCPCGRPVSSFVPLFW
jgi:hypothetical protein